MPIIKIKSIKKLINKFTCYDIETKNTHAFFANNILVHNSNFSICFEPNKPIRYASREQLVGNFFQGVMIDELIAANEDLKEIIGVIQICADENKVNINLYGELYSDKINKRVKYGAPGLRFFDVTVDGKYMTQYELGVWFTGREHLLVPCLGIAQTLDLALSFNTEVDSMILGVENNEMEGVVIKPLFNVYTSPVGDMFYIKKKNKKFLDKHNKVNKEKKEIPATAKVWKEEFLTYLTDNRLTDLFAKRGRIERMDQFGDYIKWMIEDAKEDFLKDHENFDRSFDKVVFSSAGGKVAEMLKEKM